MNNKKEEKREAGKVRKEYTKPEIESHLYQERHALACNKMRTANAHCNQNPDVS